MSCTIPGIFIPTFIDEKCIIDGGSLANFPINYCLRDHPDKNEILGFNFIYSKSDDDVRCSGNIIITPESNMLEFILGMSINSINYITTSIKSEVIPFTIEYTSNVSSLTFDSINTFITFQENRQQIYDNGIKLAKIFWDNFNDKEKDKDKDTEIILDPIIDHIIDPIIET